MGTVSRPVNFRSLSRRPVSEEGREFLSLKIHRQTLERLLRGQQLHLEELRCADSEAACTLKQLLKNCVC